MLWNFGNSTQQFFLLPFNWLSMFLCKQNLIILLRLEKPRIRATETYAVIIWMSKIRNYLYGSKCTINRFTWSFQSGPAFYQGLFPANLFLFSILKHFNYLCLAKKSFEKKPSRLKWLLAGLHDQNKSGFFGGPAFNQPIRAI